VDKDKHVVSRAPATEKARRPTV